MSNNELNRDTQSSDRSGSEQSQGAGRNSQGSDQKRETSGSDRA